MTSFLFSSIFSDIVQKQQFLNVQHLLERKKGRLFKKNFKVFKEKD